MCYDIKVSIERQLKLAKQIGDPEAISRLEKTLLPLLSPAERDFDRISGFAHPRLLVCTEMDAQRSVQLVRWGLVPDFARNSEQQLDLAKKTLNARRETLFDKIAFSEAVRDGRCLIPVDGFYEHQHRFGKTFPYFITSPDPSDQLLLAGIKTNNNLDLFQNDHHGTCSIITTRASGLMAEIHHVGGEFGPRMPLLIRKADADQWLNSKLDESEINELLDELAHKSTEHELKTYTVRRFTKEKNHPADEAFTYPELSDRLFD